MPFLVLFFFWAWFYMSFNNFVRFLMGKGPKGMTNLEMQIVNFYSRNYIFISLLASSPFMVSEASHERRREWEGLRKGKLSIISYKLSFLLRPDEAKYCWLKNDAQSINFDWRHSWLTHHYWLPYFQKHYAFFKYGLLLSPARNKVTHRWTISVKDCVAIFCTLFSLDLNLLGKYKPANQKAEKRLPGKHYKLYKISPHLLCLKVS